MAIVEGVDLVAMDVVDRVEPIAMDGIMFHL